MQARKYDVFLSYNRNDKSFVEFLVKSLERAGLAVFQDIAGLKLYDKLDASIKAAVAQSRRLIAVISPSYLQSYWCLFEAMEAIRGEDLDLRFLPIVVRYSPNDQSLDEDFVLRALSDIDQQMNLFESEMMRMKAYDLAPKLEKLQFVRQNLPRIFRQLSERIYPQFALWDDIATRATLRQVLERVEPRKAVDFVDTVGLDFERLGPTPVVVPKLGELPVLLWSARVGCLAWKNSPVVVGNDVLVGSAGRVWNQPDEEDGIYCLDAETGKQKWFAPTPADANRLLVSKGLVLVGCDDGTVVAVSARDGTPRWTAELDAGVVGGPLKLPANNASPMAFASESGPPVDPVLALTAAGTLFLLDLTSGREIGHLALGRETIAQPLLTERDLYPLVVVPATDGTLSFVQYSDITVELHLVGETPGDSLAASLAVPPILAEGLLIQGLVRDLDYLDPPMAALDLKGGSVRWSATDPDRIAGGFGNARSAPVVINREVVFATAYSGKLCAVSLDEGKLIWTVELGQAMFEQWSGPVAHGSAIYIGRHDGYLHKVDARHRRREWSIFLGENANAGVAVPGSQQLPEFAAGAAWRAGGSAPILATPTFDRGRLYVGTQEGYLYCIANLGPDDG